MHYQRWRSNGDPLIVRRRAKQAEICEREDCSEPGYNRGLCLRHYREVQKAERGACSVPTCDEPWAAKDLCTVHYERFRRTGSTDAPPEAGRPCSVKTCEERVIAQEMCGKHYAYWRKHGVPEPPPKPEKVWLPCTHAGCTELATRKNGMCNRHYRKAIAGTKPMCIEEGCPRRARTHGGFCDTHGTDLARQLKTRYNMTVPEYKAMLEAQGGGCAICGRSPSAGTRIKRLVVDHDHGCCPGDTSCGKCVRGLLCNYCNRLLGMALDDPGRLHSAIAYLETTAAKGQLALFAA
jgi:Recombination endonuclease VII